MLSSGRSAAQGQQSRKILRRRCGRTPIPRDAAQAQQLTGSGAGAAALAGKARQGSGAGGAPSKWSGMGSKVRPAVGFLGLAGNVQS